MSPKRVRIVDATLREGNQTPGVKLTAEDSVRVALQLEALGVDMIEIGHPLAGPDEHERTQAVAALGLRTPIIAHARAHEEDIRAVARAGAPWVGIFLGVNDITTRARVIGRSSPELIEMVRSAVKVAKDCGLRIRYSCEDASRTEDHFLFDAFGAAAEAGADRICYADTIGYAEPSEISDKVRRMIASFPQTETEVHLHDDRGLAIANALAAIDAGVDWISTCVNGLGERCGITDLASLLANLGIRGERDLPDLQQLMDLSKTVEAITGIHVDSMRPVVGAHAFRHGSKLHVRAMSYEPRAYDWVKEFAYRQELGRSRPPDANPAVSA